MSRDQQRAKKFTPRVLPAFGRGQPVRRRGKRLPDFTIPQILAWADEWHERMGQWPRRDSGRIPGALGVTWTAVNVALVHGNRGLPGGSSLAQLLWQKRGVWHRNGRYHRPLTIRRIVAWADAHHHKTGAWPTLYSGRVTGAPGEDWSRIDRALRRGLRSLPGGSSLARVLAEHRAVRNVHTIPDLTEATILAWADAHYRRTRKWPVRTADPVAEAPGETWWAIDAALREGARGMGGGSSLARLLAARRGVRNRKSLPKLRVRQILRWADAYKKRVGKRPTHLSGAIPEAPGETWAAVHGALANGNRGHQGGASLFQLLRKYRGETQYPPRREPRMDGPTK